MRTKIKPEQYRVERRVSGTARMSTGLGPTFREWNEPSTWAYIYRGTRLVERLSLNALSLCLPNLPSGKPSIDGMKATDEQIILAVIGDESIYG